MIKQTFLFLPGIGKLKEHSIKAQGIRTWGDFLSKEKIKGLSKERKIAYNQLIIDADKALKDYNPEFFMNNLPQSEVWRLFQSFKDEAIYLDIETTGYYGDITVIGLYDGNNTKMIIKGFNLNRGLLEKELKKYKMVVTFNGSSFDIPIINRYFGDVLKDKLHFDLRWACKSLNLEGGLKNIEKVLGIKRQEEVSNLQGSDAVYLWHMWIKTGDEYYLNLLIKYNEEDIINLKTIAEHVCKELPQKFY